MNQVKMVDLVLPSMTNSHGTLFGGKALEMMDKAAAVVALRHSRTNVVTAGMESVSFESPIVDSEIVEVIATLKEVGRTSMKVEVEVEVWGENPKSGKRTRSTKATLTMVAVTPEGKPCEVPPMSSDLEDMESSYCSVTKSLLNLDKKFDALVWESYIYSRDNGVDILASDINTHHPALIGFCADQDSEKAWRIPSYDVKKGCSDFLLPWVTNSYGRQSIAKAISTDDIGSLLERPLK